MRFLMWRQAHIAWEFSAIMDMKQLPVAKEKCIPGWLEVIPELFWLLLCEISCKEGPKPKTSYWLPTDR